MLIWFRIKALYVGAIAFLLGARTLEHGARTQVSAAFDPRWAGISGVYLHDEKVRRPSARALDTGLRKLLWAESARLCGLSW